MITPRYIVFIKENFPILSLITFLICVKLPSIDQAIYWDESIYFTPHTFKYGLNSFLPLYYKPSIYHGHPVLLQVLLLFSSFIFGNNHIAAHLVSILCFVYFLIISRRFIFEFVDKKASNLFIIFFSLLPFIFTQGFLFFPNYLMIALGLHAFYYYQKGNYNLYALFAVLTVMTRESALAFCLLPMILAFYDFIKKRICIYNFLKTTAPFISIVLFFIYNKSNSYQKAYVNHPHVAKRIQDNQIRWEKLVADVGNSFNKLLSATTEQLPSIILVIISISLIYAIIKKKINLIPNRVHLLLFSSALLFIGFFLFYGDTIPRDFTFATVLFCLYCVIVLSRVFKNEFVMMIIIIGLFLNKDRFLYIDGLDMSYAGYNSRIFIMKKIAEKINHKYHDKYWIKCSWPCTRIFEDVEYGYVTNPHRTTIFSYEADVLLRTKMNIPEDYATDLKGWKLDSVFVGTTQYSKSHFYLKKPNYKFNEDNQ